VFPTYDEFKNSNLEGDSSNSSVEDEPVAVVDRETGRKLVGNVAPTISNLVEWLQQNSSYDVAEESTSLVRSKVRGSWLRKLNGY